jgi:hypothetical protein
MLSREDLAKWQRVMVKAVSRAVFIPTWRLAYLEDTLLKRNGAAIGVHLTARNEKAG